ncbi:MAG TPA: FxLYD domain-containing protein [Nitrosopumilaceae archaeon]|nr:FxLYD domain-containing protein [Nitrosopumilaceae archaeon]
MKLLVIIIVSLSFVFSSASAQVSIINDQQYVNEDGTLHIVGEIANNTPVALNQIVVTATFYDIHDKILGRMTTDSILDTIMPGKKSPFDLISTDNIIPQIYRYSLNTEYKPAEFKTESLEILSSNAKRDMLDNFIISGTITNHDQRTANSIIVIATLYDKEGKVVATGRSYTEPEYLKAGGITPFLVSVNDKAQSQKATNYSLMIESEEYTAVPEFPLGSGVIMLLSVISYVVLAKRTKSLQQSHLA